MLAERAHSRPESDQGFVLPDRIFPEVDLRRAPTELVKSILKRQIALSNESERKARTVWLNEIGLTGHALRGGADLPRQGSALAREWDNAYAEAKQTWVPCPACGDRVPRLDIEHSGNCVSCHAEQHVPRWGGAKPLPRAEGERAVVPLTPIAPDAGSPRYDARRLIRERPKEVAASLSKVTPLQRRRWERHRLRGEPMEWIGHEQSASPQAVEKSISRVDERLLIDGVPVAKAAKFASPNGRRRHGILVSRAFGSDGAVLKLGSFADPSDSTALDELIHRESIELAKQGNRLDGADRAPTEAEIAELLHQFDPSGYYRRQSAEIPSNN